MTRVHFMNEDILVVTGMCVTSLSVYSNHVLDGITIPKLTTRPLDIRQDTRRRLMGATPGLSLAS